MATIEESHAQVVETTYDMVPNLSYPFPQTHPNRLATIATLFGMKPRARRVLPGAGTCGAPQGEI